MVGNVNEGWIVAKRLLQYERTSIGGGSGQRPRAVAEFAKDFMGTQDSRIVDRSLRDDIAEHAMNDRAFSLTVRRNVAESQSTQARRPALMH